MCHFNQRATACFRSHKHHDDEVERLSLIPLLDRLLPITIVPTTIGLPSDAILQTFIPQARCHFVKMPIVSSVCMSCMRQLCSSFHVERPTWTATSHALPDSPARKQRSRARVYSIRKTTSQLRLPATISRVHQRP